MESLIDFAPGALSRPGTNGDLLKPRVFSWKDKLPPVNTGLLEEKTMHQLSQCTNQLFASETQTLSRSLPELARSPHPEVRALVAEHPESSQQVLAQLIRDGSVEVRLALTENTNSLSWIAKELVNDENGDVRYSLAENPYTPRAVLKSLSADENPYVAVRALQTLERLEIEGRIKIAEAA